MIVIIICLKETHLGHETYFFQQTARKANFGIGMDFSDQANT